MKTIGRAAVSAALLVLGGFTAGSAGQKSGPVTPPLVIESTYGPDLYRHHCAACHGRDGKGYGSGKSLFRDATPRHVHVAAHAACRERDLCGGRRVEIALCTRLD